MSLDGPRLTTLLWAGANVAQDQAGATGTLPPLVDEPELSYEDVGLTDKLLGNGQYGQTLLVSFWDSSPGVYFHSLHDYSHLSKQMHPRSDRVWNRCVWEAKPLSCWRAINACFSNVNGQACQCHLHVKCIQYSLLWTP